MSDEPLKLSGMNLRPISPVDLGGNELQDYARSLIEDGEDYELYEVKIPGQRARAYLLHRSFTGKTIITFGSETMVNGYYPIPEAAHMFRHQIEERNREGSELQMPPNSAQEGPSLENEMGEGEEMSVGMGEGKEPIKKSRKRDNKHKDFAEKNERRIELIEKKSNLRPNQKMKAEEEEELVRLQEEVRRQVDQTHPLPVEPIRTIYNEVMAAEPTKAEAGPRKRGRPPGSKTKVGEDMKKAMGIEMENEK